MARGFARLSSLYASVSLLFLLHFPCPNFATIPWLLVLELVLFISELCHPERQIQGQVNRVNLLIMGMDNQRSTAALH